jgi:thiol peroxidase
MAITNENITFQGNKLNVIGEPVKIGELLPKFQLTGVDMKDVSNETFQGKVLVIAAIPSVDTPVCAIETKRFNEEASKLSSDVVVLAVSMDLPFAQKRWCAAEGVERVVTASDYKYRTFGEGFGVLIKEMGLHARAIFVADRSGRVKHVEYVSDITQEPDYSAVLAAIKAA